MSVNPIKSIKNNYKHFKAIIGTVSEELDYFGESKAVLSLHKVYLKTKSDKPVADYVLINKNKSTESLFVIAHQGVVNQEISFYGKILDYKEVQLYDGMKFLQNESHCKIGYIKKVRIGLKKSSRSKKPLEPIRKLN
jgi:hypothetical protein